MYTKVTISITALTIPLLFLTGCSASSNSLAKEICDAPGVLTEIEGDPNIESGAELWMKYYEKATELRNSPDATEEELAIAGAMNSWFSIAAEMDQQDLGWGAYGQEFSDAGLKLISACESFY